MERPRQLFPPQPERVSGVVTVSANTPSPYFRADDDVGQKHYSKQTVYDAHLSSNKHKKKEKEGTQHPDPAKDERAAAPIASSSTSSKDKLRPPARLTFLISALLTFPPIPQVLKDSRSEVERRMALTAREREAELEEADEAPPPPAEINTGEEEEEDDDGKIYNPLKLPLGWDGKPIPFWLYKLHGRCSFRVYVFDHKTS